MDRQAVGRSKSTFIKKVVHTEDNFREVQNVINEREEEDDKAEVEAKEDIKRQKDMFSKKLEERR